jgi:hypothetical protein
MILIITPFEGNTAFFQLQDTVVGDGNQVCISTQIFNYGCSCFEWRFTVYYPFLLIIWRQEVLEFMRVFEIL